MNVADEQTPQKRLRTVAQALLRLVTCFLPTRREARAIAKVYGSLATGGSELGITQATLDELESAITPSFDEIFRLDSAFTMGFMKPLPLLQFGTSRRSYGHTGMGGSFGLADPDAGLGYAYVMNRGGYAMPTDPRELVLREAVYRCI